MKMRSLSCILVLISVLKGIISTEFDLTIDVAPGKQDCFWQKIPLSTDVEIDYQVIDGGDMDINVMVISPDSRVLQVDQRKTDNTIKFKSVIPGDFKFCFDNTFSRISNKIVYFEMFVEDGIDDDDLGNADLTFEGEDLQEQLDMTVEDFKGILERAKKNLERSVQVQTLIRIHEARDRNTQEANFWRVNTFSIFQVTVMISVALVQVLTIRSLFSNSKTVSGATLKERT